MSIEILEFTQERGHISAKNVTRLTQPVTIYQDIYRGTQVRNPMNAVIVTRLLPKITFLKYYDEAISETRDLYLQHKSIMKHKIIKF